MLLRRHKNLYICAEVKTKVKVFVHAQGYTNRWRRGYDNSFPNIRPHELQRTFPFLKILWKMKIWNYLKLDMCL